MNGYCFIYALCKVNADNSLALPNTAYLSVEQAHNAVRELQKDSKDNYTIRTLWLEPSTN